MAYRIICFYVNISEEIGEELQETILQTISFHDATKKNREAFYHGLMLGISLTTKNRYQIKSNRESGTGRYDISWYPKKDRKRPRHRHRAQNKQPLSRRISPPNRYKDV